ncbi:MAG TPA: class I SAM-dependent methyltransferase [Longimicrobiales bacterium]|nr:class I SAM-dependent methyltransferase [Longimicrobiales bacterium]
MDYRAFPNVEGRNALQGRLEVPLFVHSLRLPKRGAVLEIGCGRGVALPVLHRLLEPTRLVGLDTEPSFLEEAAARADAEGVPVELVEGDARSLPFATASFDVVIDFGTCYHISRSDLAVREIARVLATGGVFATETKGAQMLSHPVRTRGRRLPFDAAPELRCDRHALLWAAYVRAPTELDVACPCPPERRRRARVESPAACARSLVRPR